MDGGASRRPTEASILGSLDGAEPPVEDILDPCCTPPPPQEPTPTPVGEPKKKFRFPRLILQDKKKAESTIQSCIEISPDIPEDDAKIHETDLMCCPPCDPGDTKPSKYIVSHNEWPFRAVHAEPGDLACFLAGCPPGRTNCKRHQTRPTNRRAYSTSVEGTGRNLQDDFKAIASGLAKDVAKLGISVKDVKIPSPLVIGPLVISDKPSPKDNQQNRPEINDRRSDVNIPNSLKLDGARTNDSRLPIVKAPSSTAGLSPRSSVTSIDAFPHAALSQEVAAQIDKIQPLSATVVTNFSLPGPKARRSRADRASARQPSTNGPPLIEDVAGEADIKSSDDETKRKESKPQLSFSDKLPGKDVATPQDETKRKESKPQLSFSDKMLEKDVAAPQDKMQLQISEPTPEFTPPPRVEDKGNGVQSQEEIQRKISEPRITLPGEVPTKEDSAKPREETISQDPRPSDALSALKPANELSGRGLGRVRTRIYSDNTAESEVTDTLGIMVQVAVDVEDGEVRDSDDGTVNIDEVVKRVLTEDLVDISSPSDSIKGEQKLGSDPEPVPGRALEDDPTSRPAQDSDQVLSSKNKRTSEPSNTHASESTDLSMLEALPTPPVGHLTNLKNAIEFVDTVRGRMHDVGKKYEKKAKVQEKRAVDSKEPSTKQNDIVNFPPVESSPNGQSVPQPSFNAVSPKSAAKYISGIDSATNADKSRGKHPLLAASKPSSPDRGTRENTEQTGPEPGMGQALLSRTTSALPTTPRTIKKGTLPVSDVDPLNSAYWGFVPAVKEAVQDAVQVAVRNAVHEIVVPPGAEQDMASDAYRKLVADSLSQAAHKADEYLRRASLWNGPASSPRMSPELAKSNKLGDVANIPENGLPNNQENNAKPGGEQAPKTNASRYGSASTASNFETPRNRSASPHSLLSNILETVPLDMEQQEEPAQKRGSKFSVPWKRGTSPRYTEIPTRKSSMNRVLGPKASGTNSSQKLSPKNSGTRARSYERLASKSEGLHSMSSAGSLQSSGANAKDDSQEKFSRNNTVHWLKELLSSEAPYEPRLTALPPRTRRGETPVEPVTQLYLGAIPDPAADPDPTKPDAAKIAPEAFTRTINDLENLLNEALLIARQAADMEDAAKVPAILEDATKMLKARRNGPYEGIPYDLEGRDRVSSRSLDRRGSDDMSSVPSIHESLRSYSESSASEYSDDDEAARQAPVEDIENGNRYRSVTVSSNAAGLNHPAGWPPTGRVSTPYPPASEPVSRESIAADFPSMEKAISDDSIEHIKAADPRSGPPETSLPPSKSTQQKRLSSGPSLQRVSTKFITLEPFSSKTSAGIKRESSAKSPGRLSPARKSVAARDSTVAADVLGISPNAAENSRENQASGPQLQTGSSVAVGRRRQSEDEHGSIRTKQSESGPVPLPRGSSLSVCKKGHSEDEHDAIKTKLSEKSIPNKREVREYIETFRHPPIQPRSSSLALRKQAENPQGNSRGYQVVPGTTYDWQDIDQEQIEPCSKLASDNPVSMLVPGGQKFSQGQLTSYSHSLDGTMTNTEEMDFSVGYTAREHGTGKSGGGQPPAQPAIELKDMPDPNLPETNTSRRRKNNDHDLRGKSHVSLKEHKGFSLARSHKRQTIARDWSPGRKRFVAAVACISTALVGILVGIYAGEVPAIQYYIVDFHHYTVLGNVFFFIALAIPSFIFWPLPLLHGRKPYILGAMSIAMPLLFPQALAVGQFRSPYVSTWRVGLILSRALMGFCLGFANMNFKSTLTDLFGASLQSENPHQEVVDEFDVRRHGGGMGIWLGLWTWSAMGSIGVGFMAGAIIINTLTPAWGFYISIVIIALVLLLNVVTPEVRRSAYRRSVAEVRNGAEVSRRLARGEVKMHMVQTGPKWWGEEFHYGIQLSKGMLRQPGFLVMALYVAWMYAQIVLIIVLLGALMSKYYKFKSPEVGYSVLAVPLGAMVAIPFQSASIFSRSRKHEETDDDTFDKKVHWSSHLVRRAIFILVLPFAGMGYTLTSIGPPIPFIIPILFAALIGFLSNLAMAECHGIMMETFDTSDLQPGMTGRPRGKSGDKTAHKRTNYSSFPRVASAFAITEGIGYLFAAIATGVGGSAERQLGAQAATGIMAGILLILSILLLLVLARFKEVQIIPDSKADEMSRWRNARRASISRKAEGAEDEDEPWRPVIIGNPTHHTRRMCLLEMGGLTRWSEIRRKNRLVDEQGLEAKHPNLVALEEARARLQEAEQRVVHNIRRSLSRGSSRGSRGSRNSDNANRPEGGDLGGHREMLSPAGKGGRRRKSTIKE
ncbi:hypothetical protein LSUE1_G000742 [Lachnellula suecica]|uniref:Uncharacterized protein n=1 Tax=Lachnellula suecica TaxID=602035 RepID=A0A8T9CJ87_9HELO|nr:hypothetical protein LSUE1_G000742 [Lachnellula suecica]